VCTQTHRQSESAAETPPQESHRPARASATERATEGPSESEPAKCLSGAAWTSTGHFGGFALRTRGARFAPGTTGFGLAAWWCALCRKPPNAFGDQPRPCPKRRAICPTCGRRRWGCSFGRGAGAGFAGGAGLAAFACGQPALAFTSQGGVLSLGLWAKSPSPANTNTATTATTTIFLNIFHPFQNNTFSIKTTGFQTTRRNRREVLLQISPKDIKWARRPC